MILVLRARSSCAWARFLLGRRDPVAYRAVLAEAAKPEKAKALGRGVRNFTEEAWGAAVLTVAREVAIARLGVEFMPGTFGVLLTRSCVLVRTFLEQVVLQKFRQLPSERALLDATGMRRCFSPLMHLSYHIACSLLRCSPTAADLLVKLPR